MQIHTRKICMDLPMPINVNNPEADALTRTFAEMAGVGITEAIVIAMREAIARPRGAGDAAGNSGAGALEAWRRPQRQSAQAAPGFGV